MKADDLNIADSRNEVSVTRQQGQGQKAGVHIVWIVSGGPHVWAIYDQSQ